ALARPAGGVQVRRAGETGHAQRAGRVEDAGAGGEEHARGLQGGGQDAGDLLAGQLGRGGGVERHCGAHPFRGGGVFRDRRAPGRLSEDRSAVHARIVPHAPPRMSPSRDTPGPLPASSRDPVPGRVGAACHQVIRSGAQRVGVLQQVSVKREVRRIGQHVESADPLSEQCPLQLSGPCFGILRACPVAGGSLPESLHVGARERVAVLVLVLVVLGRLGAGGVLGRLGRLGAGGVLGGGRLGAGGGGVVLGRLGAGGGGVLGGHLFVLSRYSAHGRSTSARSRATVVSG